MRIKEIQVATMLVLGLAWHGCQEATPTNFTTGGDEIPAVNAQVTPGATFSKGKIGLWTKSDSVSAFDDLEASTQ